MKFWETYKRKLKEELSGEDYKRLPKKEKKIKLMQDISNHNQTMWIWILVAIFFSWTIIGLIVGIVGAFWAYELKSKKEIKLKTLDD